MCHTPPPPRQMQATEPHAKPDPAPNHSHRPKPPVQEPPQCPPSRNIPPPPPTPPTHSGEFHPHPTCATLPPVHDRCRPPSRMPILIVQQTIRTDPNRQCRSNPNVPRLETFPHPVLFHQPPHRATGKPPDVRRRAH